MRVSKIFSAVFALLGLALMILTLVLSLNSLGGAVYMPQLPEGAAACTDQLMDALSRGDYPAAEVFLYGSSDLGDAREPSSAEGRQVWKAFLESIEYSFPGPCYATSSGICRDVTITTLNISSVSGNLPQRVQTLLDQRIADAREVKNMDLVYGEDGQVLDTVIDSILHTAVSQALAQDAQLMTTTVTLELVSENGTWQVLPSQELLKAATGGL